MVMVVTVVMVVTLFMVVMAVRWLPVMSVTCL